MMNNVFSNYLLFLSLKYSSSVNTNIWVAMKYASYIIEKKNKVLNGRQML